MIKLNSDLTRGLDVFKNNVSSAGFNQTNSQAPKTQSDTVHVSQSHQQSFTFFYRSVHSKLEQALDAKTSKLEQEIAEQKLAEQNERADVAANNILKFVEHQLKQDVADGSSKEQLESRTCVRSLDCFSYIPNLEVTIAILAAARPQWEQQACVHHAA